MTRLELAQFVAEKLGTEDIDDFTSTTLPADDYQRLIVNYVDIAWDEIQTMHEGVWHWRREQVTGSNFQLASGTRAYAFSSINADCVGVLPFQTAQNAAPYILIAEEGQGDTMQYEVKFIPYQQWRGYQDRGSRSSQRPQYFTIRHDGGTKIEFDPTPDATYDVELDILHDVQTLSADADVPLMPVRFHKTIAYRACMYTADYDKDKSRQLFDRAYQIWLNNLSQDQLPKGRFVVRPLGR